MLDIPRENPNEKNKHFLGMTTELCFEMAHFSQIQQNKWLSWAVLLLCTYI